MQELVKYIAQTLVEHPESVEVIEKDGPESVILELHVSPEDMGKVIGRQGKIAKEIRVLMRSVAQKQGKRISVDIVD